MWQRMKSWFRDSETIFWARLQAFLGFLAVVATFVEPAALEPILPPSWLPWVIVANGIFTEYLRRRRETPQEPKGSDEFTGGEV